MPEDLRDFIAAVDDAGELHAFAGADWDLEIGAITEVLAERGGGLGGPALLFDDIPGYPPGFRVVSNTFGSIERSRLALGMASDLDPLGMVDEWRRGVADRDDVPPVTVDADGAPVLENRVTADAVDVTMFPAPRWHAQDGGRYIGTGCTAITRHPDSGWVNLGVYRSMIVDDRTVSLWVAPGKDARVAMEAYHDRGEACPVALVLGLDPKTWIASTMTARRGETEYGIAGWLHGEGVPVIEGPETGLPIPASAEIALEGRIPPVAERSCVDGPFGEWPGYLTGEHADTPVIEVDAVAYRDDPILLGQPPLKPPAVYTVGVPVRTAGGVWNQLDAAGVPGITGVWTHVIERAMFLVVQVDTQYDGHGKQVALAAAGVPNGAFNGRFVIVVDTDVDITSLEDVVWAMVTRAPAGEIDVVQGVYTSPLDPVVEDRSHATSDRVLIDATIPPDGDFPEVNRFDDAYREEITERWDLDEI